MWRLASRKHPSGPRHWEDHTLNLSGTNIRFMALAQNHELIERDETTSDTLNIWGDQYFGRFNEENKHEPVASGLVFRDWVFSGFLGRVIGDMKLQISVSKMPEFASLFRPKHLECAIERYIFASSYSPQVSGKSRLNWTIRNNDNATWVNYGLIGNPGFHNAEEVVGSVWHTPITDEHLLSVYFKEIIRIKNSRLHETYQELIEKVMSSFAIKLSEDAQQQKDAVLSQYPDETLSEHLPPYEFEEFPELDEYELAKQVSARYNYEKPYQELKPEIQEEEESQRRKVEEVRQRVLASHLRFRDNE